MMTSIFAVIARDAHGERCEGLFGNITDAEARCRALLEAAICECAQVMRLEPATGIFERNEKA